MNSRSDALLNQIDEALTPQPDPFCGEDAVDQLAPENWPFDLAQCIRCESIEEFLHPVVGACKSCFKQLVEEEDDDRPPPPQATLFPDVNEIPETRPAPLPPAARLSSPNPFDVDSISSQPQPLAGFPTGATVVIDFDLKRMTSHEGQVRTFQSSVVRRDGPNQVTVLLQDGSQELQVRIGSSPRLSLLVAHQHISGTVIAATRL